MTTDTTEQYREWINFGIQLAKRAGTMMVTASGRNTSIEEKSCATDLVTETDKAVEAYLFSEIKKKYPHHKTIGEESSSDTHYELSDEATWIIDPVDGTMNFVHTFDFCCVSIGITHKKEPVVGIVYNPFLNKLFTAIKNCGSYCNGSPIHVRATSSLKDALVIVEMGSDNENNRRDAVCANVQALAWKCHGLRALGSAAMNICTVASGQADAYFEFGLHCWDMAASAVIASEAGAVVVDTQLGPLDLMNRRILVASSESLAKQLSQTLVLHPQLKRD